VFISASHRYPSTKDHKYLFGDLDSQHREMALRNPYMVDMYTE
jgi:hypothetical protein